MDAQQIKNILEAGLLVAARPLTVAQLEVLFQQDEVRPDRQLLRDALAQLQQDYEGRGIELIEVASGFRLQSRASMAPWVANLFQEKSPRYSRALLETLVLIAYRQPITRGEIEEVRGVAVSANIVKTLQERQWVKVIGHKEVPGRPALLGTTRQFLDYFNLKRLDDLPTLGEIKNLEEIESVLAEEAGLTDADIHADGEGGDSQSSESTDTQHQPVTENLAIGGIVAVAAMEDDEKAANMDTAFASDATDIPAADSADTPTSGTSDAPASDTPERIIDIRISG